MVTYEALTPFKMIRCYIIGVSSLETIIKTISRILLPKKIKERKHSAPVSLLVIKE